MGGIIEQPFADHDMDGIAAPAAAQQDTSPFRRIWHPHLTGNFCVAAHLTSGSLTLLFPIRLAL